jgi:hypothetical protein
MTDELSRALKKTITSPHLIFIPGRMDALSLMGLKVLKAARNGQVEIKIAFGIKR